MLLGENTYSKKKYIHHGVESANFQVTEPILLPRSMLLVAENDMDLAWRLARERLSMESKKSSSWSPWMSILPNEEMLKEYHVAYVSWLSFEM